MIFDGPHFREIQMNCKRQSLGLTFGAAFAAALWPSTAGADVQNAIYIAPNAFSYKIKHMPDLDQRRGLLPGQGAMYCVPTGTMNLLAYAADHGFASLSPGDRNWRLPENYNDMTGFIFDIGEIMDTHPVDGTGSPYGATVAWLFQNQAPLTASHYYANSSWFPKIQNLVHTAISTGGVISFVYGRYPVQTLLPGFMTVGDRSGGHMVTLSEANRFGTDINIGVRDPADEPQTGIYLFTQSPYSTRYLNNAEERLVFFPEIGALECTVLSYPPSGTRAAIIDSYLALRPKQGFGWSPSNQIIATFVANPFLGDPNGSQQTVTIGAGNAIIAAALAPEGTSSYALVQSPGLPTTLVSVDHVKGSWEPMETIPGAAAMVVGRNRKLYVVASGQLHCYDVDSGGAQLEGSAFMDGEARAVTYCDRTDEVIALLSNNQTILKFKSTLPDMPPEFIDVPNVITMQGDGAVAVNPVDGKIWFFTEASDALYNLEYNPPIVHFTSVALPEVTDPRSISFDDYGDLFVMSGDGLFQYRVDPADNRWKLVQDPLFGDMAPLMDFQVAQSRTNFDPEIHNGPAYMNFEPSENDALLPTSMIQVDCDADINGDRTVDGADLAELLAAWGECEICIGDLSGNRIVNGVDLASLLNAWGPCD